MLEISNNSPHKSGKFKPYLMGGVHGFVSLKLFKYYFIFYLTPQIQLNLSSSLPYCIPVIVS